MFKNWKTSTPGSGALITAFIDLYHGVSTKNYANVVPDIMGILVGLGLINAKDWNVTGGSVPQTIEAENRSRSEPVK